MLTTTLTDDVLTVTMDDGKRNVLTAAGCDRLCAVLEEHPDAKAIVLAGREGAFSAGLDRGVVDAGDPEAMRTLLLAVGRCLMRWWTEPRPTVAAATGHALAGGTLLAMACDHSIASEQGWWGLIETQVGLALPVFALTLARHHVRNDRYEDLLLPGRRVDAHAAVEAGFADEVTTAEAVVARAQAHASTLAQLPPAAYAATKRRLRQADADAVLAGLEADVAELLTAH